MHQQTGARRSPHDPTFGPTGIGQNRFTESDEVFVPAEWWDACTREDLHPVREDRLLPVFVGVDASVKHDSTAIVVVHRDFRSGRVRLVWHRTFNPRPDDPISFYDVEETLLDLKRRFRVLETYYDPYQFAGSAQRLVAAGIKLREFPQTVANLTVASQNLYELIRSRSIEAYPDPELRLAVSRAVARETTRGWRIGKDKQSHKIDFVVALGMAAYASLDSKASRGARYTGGLLGGAIRDSDKPENRPGGACRVGGVSDRELR